MYDLLCPGCGHRIAMKIIDDILIEKNLAEKTIFACDVGCCSLLIDYVSYDAIMCPHGRVIPVSMGLKIHSDNFVLSYMGDGAAYSIGFNEMIHVAQRKDDLLVVVVNNGVFAMTGGQKSTANIKNNDFLIEEILKPFRPNFLARSIISDKKNIDLTREYLEEAFDSYMTRGGFNIVELLSPCPTNYHTTIDRCIDELNNNISKRYKVIKCKN